ncbi:MAG: hypothetical protein R3Y07_03390 [Eubacteriales bacterium]
MKITSMIVLSLALAVGALSHSKPVVHAEEMLPLSQSGTTPALVEFWSPTQAPIQGMVLSMVERDLVYDESDPYFLWSSLYYTISLTGQSDFRVEMSDQYFSIPEEMVLDYANAIFENVTKLPEIPDDLHGFISYREETDRYELGLGDMALVETRILNVTPMEGNTYQITGVMVDLATEQSFLTYQGILKRDEGMFGFSFQDFEIL